APNGISPGFMAKANHEPHRQSVRILSYLVVLSGSFLAYFTANPLLTVGCILTLLLLGKLLWRPGEPPVLVFVAGLQWVQVATLVLEADANGTNVAALSVSPSVETAIWLSLGGLLVLAVGLRLATSSLRAAPHAIIQSELRNYS